MSFTYDLSTNIGKLRFELQDINEDDYEFSDEELEYCLTKSKNNIAWAGVYACEARCMKECSLNGLEIEVGDTRIKGGVTAGLSWCTIAKDRREKLETGLSTSNPIDMYAFTSGIFVQDRRANERNIEDGLIIERDFYDYYNESGVRGGTVDNDHDTHPAN